ncbi:hypothetical protein N4P33_34360, partial [Streptomyces sp. 15-116A]|nr:hypothetical protein [Streptomyces sp. 15-116A]
MVSRLTPWAYPVDADRAVPSATPASLVKFEDQVITAQTTPPAPPFILSDLSELAHCFAVFVPGDPARTGEIAFWRPDGSPPPAAAPGHIEELTVVVPGADGAEAVVVPALLVPVRAALPVLTRARAGRHGHRAAVFWGAAAVHALHLVARGLLLP